MLLKNEIDITTTDQLLFGSLVYENNGVVINCKVSGTIIISSNYRDGNNYAYIGGFAAYNNGLIKNSYSDATMQAHNEYDSIHCGGIAAETSGSIINCFSSGNITASSRNSYVLYYPVKVSGITGAVDDGAEVINCFSVGTIKGTSGSYSSSVSAIAYTGYDGISFNINNCYRTNTQILIRDGSTISHNSFSGNPIIDYDFSQTEYEAMQYLEFVSEDDLLVNENNVWIISGTGYPKLYWEV